ncbi:cupin domain-containing protein [Actinokineospora sp.]|uniref:cupin domain-containing protein n=1 Tax=Actinokineospora sp. TaxID=1872133 RepID=UPI003D6BE182
MTTYSRLTATSQILGPGEGEILGDQAATTDRFMINGGESDGRLALVEHGLTPRAPAAPVHRRSREDEYSYVLAGEVGVLLGEREVVGRPGDLIFKPRGQWHTF